MILEKTRESKTSEREMCRLVKVSKNQKYMYKSPRFVSFLLLLLLVCHVLIYRSNVEKSVVEHL